MKCKYIHGDFSIFSVNGITIGNESGDRDEDGDRKSNKGILSDSGSGKELISIVGLLIGAFWICLVCVGIF